MGKNDVNQIADNVRVQFIGRPDKRSASGNLTLVISLMPITLLMWWWVN